MRAPLPLLERATLQRLERLVLRWEQSFSGLLGGNNVSRLPGVGHEFLDHRHFQSGDDLRSVNWRAYLRLEKLFLKMFRTEPRTPVRIWMDTSESMACGSDDADEAKFPFACRLAAALCYVGLVRLETMVLQPFTDRLGEDFRSHGGRNRFAGASHFIGGLESGGRSDFSATVRSFLSSAPPPGLLIVISDFLDDSGCGSALQMLADQGSELHLIQLAGPTDRMPPWDGELELEDAESGEIMRVQLDREAAQEYAASYDAYSRQIEQAAMRSQGRYLQLRTDQPLEDALYGPMTQLGAVSVQ